MMTDGDTNDQKTFVPQSEGRRIVTLDPVWIDLLVDTIKTSGRSPNQCWSISSSSKC
ncbi:hypothetical protein YC2023_034846 [Brassica napus]